MPSSPTLNVLAGFRGFELAQSSTNNSFFVLCISRPFSLVTVLFKFEDNNVSISVSLFVSCFHLVKFVKRTEMSPFLTPKGETLKELFSETFKSFLKLIIYLFI